jgi:hypothetical protein
MPLRATERGIRLYGWSRSPLYRVLPVGALCNGLEAWIQAEGEAVGHREHQGVERYVLVPFSIILETLSATAAR